MDHWIDSVVNLKSKAYGEKENSIPGILKLIIVKGLFQNS